MASPPTQPVDVDAAPAVVVSGPGSLTGTVAVPGDKSISHRALLLSGLAEGDTVIEGLSRGEDVGWTRRALTRFGVTCTDTAAGVRVSGGVHAEPDEPLYHGNSGTGLRLMAGVCAGLDSFVVLTGDESLRQRPMDRVAAPLREMGAHVDGRHSGSLPPLAIRGGGLRGITYRLPVASAQIKSAVLLAGLRATGRTTVTEPTVTRRHTEDMLTQFGIDITVDGPTISVAPGTPTSPGTVSVPGDPSQAAFWIVAALITPDSAVRVNDLYLGTGRAGFLTTLARMGADLDIDTTAGTVAARAGSLHAVDIGPADVADLIDEIPILAVAAAHARGTTVISGAAELRVKESDRIASTVAMLTAFGARATAIPDGMIIDGSTPLHAPEVHAHGDHRIAMSAAIAALTAPGETVIHGWDCVATSYPGFAADLTELTDSADTITPTGVEAHT